MTQKTIETNPDPFEYVLQRCSRGKCEVCSTEYDARTTWIRRDGLLSYWQNEPCPSCAYPFELEKIIRDILEKKVTFEMTGKGRYDGNASLKINFEGLATEINATVIKYWPPQAAVEKNETGGG